MMDLATQDEAGRMLERANVLLDTRPGSAEWDRDAAQWVADYRPLQEKFDDALSGSGRDTDPDAAT
jgi:hypothetical protein